MTWLNWSLKLHSRLRTIPHLIHTHTTYKSNVQWMLISFVWLYMFKCNVCVLNHMWIKPKRFLFFFVCFWKWFVSPLFFKNFQVVFEWKTCFLGVFTRNFASKALSQSLDREFHDYFASKTYSRKISRVISQVSFLQKFPDQLFKWHFLGHLF